MQGMIGLQRFTHHTHHALFTLPPTAEIEKIYEGLLRFNFSESRLGRFQKSVHSFWDNALTLQC